MLPLLSRIPVPQGLGDEPIAVDRGDHHVIYQPVEKELGAAPVEFHVAQLIDAEQVDAAVAVDGLGQLLVVGGLDELVDERRPFLTQSQVARVLMTAGSTFGLASKSKVRKNFSRGFQRP